MSIRVNSIKNFSILFRGIPINIKISSSVPLKGYLKVKIEQNTINISIEEQDSTKGIIYSTEVKPENEKLKKPIGCYWCNMRDICNSNGDVNENCLFMKY